jgi:hypothetical protein
MKKTLSFLNISGSSLLQTSKYLLLGTFSASIAWLLPYSSNPGVSAPLQVAQTTTDEIPNIVVIPGERIHGNNSNAPSRNRTVTPQTSSDNSISTSKISLIPDVTVNANPIAIILYDNGSEDGDIVRVTVNGQSLPGLDNVVLTNVDQTFYIDLQQGLNTVEVTALNEGSSSPNTATLVIPQSQVVLGGNVFEANQPTGSTTSFTVFAPDLFGNCKTNDNLGEVADSFISRCRKASIRAEFPGELLGETLGNIKRGNAANYKKAWKLLNDGRFKKPGMDT